jgi:hypothetical protein
MGENEKTLATREGVARAVRRAFLGGTPKIFSVIAFRYRRKFSCFALCVVRTTRGNPRYTPMDGKNGFDLLHYGLLFQLEKQNPKASDQGREFQEFIRIASQYDIVLRNKHHELFYKMQA